MKKYRYPLLILAVSSLLVYCKTNKQTTQQTASSTTSTVAKEEKPAQVPSKSPFIPASETIGKMVIEDGFEAKLIASEPLVSAPVAMQFDDKARMWVVEMV